MKVLDTRTFAVALLILFGLSILANPAFAGPSEPETTDYAEFRYVPYPLGPNQITIHFEHESYCTLYVYLYRFNSQVKSWTVNQYTRSGWLYYSASVDGVWRLKCYMSGYTPYWTDQTKDNTYGISDPEPTQNNLGSDWARHPEDWNIYEQALIINGATTSSYSAAQNIYSHVVTHFNHTQPKTFNYDLALLNDLKTYGHYHGMCRSDAVILTSYARALGIPARIIHLLAHFEPVPGGGPHDPKAFDDHHYFAEFCVFRNGQKEWVPVDGDPEYDWFDWTQANQEIKHQWPHEVWDGGELIGWYTIQYMGIVYNIPHENIEDEGYSQTPYSNWQLYYPHY